MDTLKINCNFNCAECEIFQKMKEISIECYLKGLDATKEFKKAFGKKVFETKCNNFFVDYEIKELG